MPDELLTVQEAAERMGLAKPTVHAMLQKGLMPGAKRHGERVWMIPESATKPGGWRKAYTFFLTDSEYQKLTALFEKIKEG